MNYKDFALNYYSKPGKLTDLGVFVEQAENLSSDPEELSKTVQGLLIHDMWLERSGVKFTKSKRCNALNPGVEDMINTANKR